jgi:NAD(P)-dependent dehydrogenase (short-subunit alcohol dehydrogenase family)
MRLHGKVAVITGASSGIGRATALLFSTEGAKVVVSDIDSDGGNETVRMIGDRNGDAFFVQADVSRGEDVRKMIGKTVEQYGKLDILFNNAGIGCAGTVVDIPEEKWDRTIEVNLKSVFLACKYAIPFMMKQGGGSIINAASVNGLFGFYNEAAYDASKGGVVLLTRATALDFGSRNIRVNCICPGVVETSMTRNWIESSPNPEEFRRELVGLHPGLNRLITPDEVAHVALFLASDESSGITGAAYTVDGGYSAL